MPRRIVDGEGVWGSDKLAKVKPDKYRAEYTNILPLSLANGVFEASPSRVWSTVYAYNRPDISRNDVERILSEFDRVGLLFRWNDEGGKAWGYFIGSDKRGRLPAQSLRERYGVGPNPPADRLTEYLQRSGQPITEIPAPSPPKRSPAKTPLPENFAISEPVQKWAKQRGYTDLEKHLEHFKGVAKARGYSYVDWDSAFQNAIRDNWAKLEQKPQSNGPSLLERTKAQLEAQ